MSTTDDYPRRHAITVEEYLRMGEAYVFGPHARLELMEGELVEMASTSSAHASVVNTLAALLAEVAPRAIVSVQNPLVLSERSALQPDIVLLRPRADHYYNSHPETANALLVVEVSDTTLEHDLGVKRPLYARAATAELWIVDIDRRELLVYREPKADYSMHCVLMTTDNATVAALNNVGFAVASLFPRM